MTTTSLWQQTVDKAERELRLSSSGEWVVTRDSLVSEQTPYGRLRWYLHPELEDRCTRALYFHELEIPVGSRSGRILHPGGIVHLVVEGSGYTELDGESHEWEAEDVIVIPPRTSGNRFQHVNTGPSAARLVVAWPNYDGALGPGLGTGLRVLEPAPEWNA
jgi:quercetin dioxygenase-like cupin family protein